MEKVYNITVRRQNHAFYFWNVPPAALVFISHFYSTYDELEIEVKEADSPRRLSDCRLELKHFIL